MSSGQRNSRIKGADYAQNDYCFSESETQNPGTLALPV